LPFWGLRTSAIKLGARVFSGASDRAFINRSACSLLARANGATTRFTAQLDSRPQRFRHTRTGKAQIQAV
jgi:hypothetical protein